MNSHKTTFHFGLEALHTKTEEIYSLYSDQARQALSFIVDKILLGSPLIAIR